MVVIWLTLLVALILVIALVGFLIAIAVALTRTWREVGRIADSLERTASATEPLGDKVSALDLSIRQLSQDTTAIADHLAGAGQPAAG